MRRIVASPRPIRIPRARPVPSAAPRRARRAERRENRGGTQRAFRFMVLYLVALLTLDLILIGLDLTSSEAARPAVQSGLDLFIGVAVALAIGSVVLALTPAPRAVEVPPDRTVVVGRWGTRREFPPLSELELKVLHRYPSGLLSDVAVEAVRLVDVRGRKATYQVEAGLFDPVPDAASAA